MMARLQVAAIWAGIAAYSVALFVGWMVALGAISYVLVWLFHAGWSLAAMVIG